jgi:hypothetical protein
MVSWNMQRSSTHHTMSCTGSEDPLVTPDQLLAFGHALKHAGGPEKAISECRLTIPFLKSRTFSGRGP